VPYIETSVIAFGSNHRDLRALKERKQERKDKGKGYTHTHLLHMDGRKGQLFERKEKGKGKEGEARPLVSEVCRRGKRGRYQQGRGKGRDMHQFLTHTTSKMRRQMRYESTQRKPGKAPLTNDTDK